MNKYVICAMLGALIKIYDDLYDLFFYKNKKVMELIKIITIFIYGYYLFVLQSNIYDILWLLYIWAFIPIVFDWKAYMAESYFFGSTICISLLCFFIIFKSYTISIFNLFLSLLLYTICTPYLESVLSKNNGIIHDFFKKLGIISNTDSIKFTKTEREVSFKKLMIRMLNLFISILIVVLLTKYKSMFGPKYKNLILSGIQIAYFWCGYCIISILDQSYVLSVDPSIIELHKRKNNEI